MIQKPEKREVVITGIGVVSPIGTGKTNFCESLYEGKSGIDFITLFDASNFPTKFAGEAEGFDPERLLKGTDVLKHTKERRLLLANCAAHLAVDDAGLAIEEFPGERCAAVLGSGVHPVIPEMEFYWEPMHDALIAVLENGVEPAIALQTASDLITEQVETFKDKEGDF